MISVYYYPYITDEQAKEEGGSMTCPMSHGQEVAKSISYSRSSGLGSITMNKASEGDGIPVELFYPKR